MDDKTTKRIKKFMQDFLEAFDHDKKLTIKEAKKLTRKGVNKSWQKKTRKRRFL